MIAAERHQSLAAALVSRGGPVVDLGCGSGQTLRAIRERLGPEVELVGVERNLATLDPQVSADPHVREGAADLSQPLPFPDAIFEAAVCHNTLECLPDKPAFLREVARILRPGGHLLLGHTDFDTTAFNASDIELTRRMVHANTDTQEAWMDASDGAMVASSLPLLGGLRSSLWTSSLGSPSTRASLRAALPTLPGGALPQRCDATTITS